MTTRLSNDDAELVDLQLHRFLREAAAGHRAHARHSQLTVAAMIQERLERRDRGKVLQFHPRGERGHVSIEAAFALLLMGLCGAAGLMLALLTGSI